MYLSPDVGKLQHTNMYPSKNYFSKHLSFILLRTTWQAFQGADPQAKHMHRALEHLHLHFIYFAFQKKSRCLMELGKATFSFNYTPKVNQECRVKGN